MGVAQEIQRWKIEKIEIKKDRKGEKHFKPRSAPLLSPHSDGLHLDKRCRA
jgi:hypothetical protein